MELKISVTLEEYNKIRGRVERMFLKKAGYQYRTLNDWKNITGIVLKVLEIEIKKEKAKGEE